MTIGERIKALRESNKMTQTDLAERIGTTKQNRVSDYLLSFVIAGNIYIKAVALIPLKLCLDFLQRPCYTYIG